MHGYGTNYWEESVRGQPWPVTILLDDTHCEARGASYSYCGGEKAGDVCIYVFMYTVGSRIGVYILQYGCGRKDGGLVYLCIFVVW